MTVEISEPHPADVATDAIASFASDTLIREGVDASALLSIVFVDIEVMASMNADHMGKRGPTDVLSFPIEDATPGIPPKHSVGGPPLVLGDIFISSDVVKENAEGFGVSFDDELYLMVCHGVLHILGWDHQTDSEAEAMEAREAGHLATIGRTRR